MMLGIAKIVSLAAAGLLFCSCAVRGEEMKVGGTGAALGLLKRLAHDFAGANPGDSVEVVAGLGSSGAITAVGEGVLQLAVIGRPLKSDEQAGRLTSTPFLDTPFIFVTSHPARQSVTSDDVVQILSGTLRMWPDGAEIRPILRPRSDAAAMFLLERFEGLKTGMDNLRRRPDVPVAATDQDNADVAQRTPNSFAGMTLLQFEAEKLRLGAIPLDGVPASLETLRAGTYPLHMRLSLVWSAQPSQVALRFRNFLGETTAATIIRDSGGVPAPLPAP